LKSKITKIIAKETLRKLGELRESKNFETQKKIFQHLKLRVKNKCFLKKGTYLQLIKYYKTETKTFSISSSYNEIHHILPKHAGGQNTVDNRLRLSIRRHILAHLVRFLEYGEEKDLKAYLLRKQTQNVDLSSHGKRIVIVNRELGQGFWNSETQAELGRRGGSKGGLANTEAQFLSRQAVGKKFG
jgi:hypothetical protein